MSKVTNTVCHAADCARAILAMLPDPAAPPSEGEA